MTQAAPLRARAAGSPRQILVSAKRIPTSDDCEIIMKDCPIWARFPEFLIFEGSASGTPSTHPPRQQQRRLTVTIYSDSEVFVKVLSEEGRRQPGSEMCTR